MDDSEIRAAAASGDGERAFTLLLQAHGDRSYGLIRHMMGDDDMAASVWREVMVDAHGRLARATDRVSLRVWLHGLARKPLLKALAAEARRLAEFAPPTPEHRPGIDGVMSDDELFEALEEGTHKLKDPIRLALLLRFQERLDYAEIEHICDESRIELRRLVTIGLMLVRMYMERRGKITKKYSSAARGACNQIERDGLLDLDEETGAREHIARCWNCETLWDQHQRVREAFAAIGAWYPRDRDSDRAALRAAIERESASVLGRVRRWLRR